MNDITNNGKASLSRVVTFMVDQSRLADTNVQDMRQSLNSLQLVNAMSNIALEHNLSAPLVDAFRAIPGFTQAVENFPSADGFNIVPEHATTHQNMAGLEAFEVARGKVTDTIRDAGLKATDRTTIILKSADAVIEDLKLLVANAQVRLEQSDVTDEVLDSLHVSALTQEAYITVFTQLEQCATAIAPFNTDTLRAYPNQARDEYAGLEAMVEQVGPVLGLTLDQYGLVERDRANEFYNSDDTFTAKNLSKTALLHHLAQASSLLDNLRTVVDNVDAMATSANAEMNTIPVNAETTDTEFGYLDQARLFMSHTTLTAKVLRESFSAITSVLEAVDTAVNIDHGFDAV